MKKLLDLAHENGVSYKRLSEILNSYQIKPDSIGARGVHFYSEETERLIKNKVQIELWMSENRNARGVR